MQRFLSNKICPPGQPRFFLFLLLFLLFIAACQPVSVQNPTSAITPDTIGVSGSVLKKDGSVANGAFVYAYRSAKNGLRGPADFGARVDSDGRYFLDLVEGKYYLVARLRKSGADAGPPRAGDAWSIYQQNPLQVEPGQVANIDFILQGGGLPRQARKGSLTTGDTGFSGRLVDEQGNPFTGALALAYRSTDFHRMPDLTSMPADTDGQFILYVPDPGRYCLAARISSRGQPRSGEPYGVLGEGEKACRQVAAGAVIDVGAIILRPYR